MENAGQEEPPVESPSKDSEDQPHLGFAPVDDLFDESSSEQKSLTFGDVLPPPYHD